MSGTAIRFRFTPAFIYVLIAAVCLVFIARYLISAEKGNPLINSDGRGYYAYLPAVFIYGDLTYQKVLAAEQEATGNYNLVASYITKAPNGRTVNKYFSGVALLESPFFAAATVVCLLTGKPPEGFNAVYQSAIGFAALFYVLLGLYWLSCFLKLFDIKPGVRAFVIACIYFGTNLFYYTVYEPGMSHVYSFCLVSGFMFFVKKYFTSGQNKNLLYAALLFSVICLVRPANAIVFFAIPFLAGSLQVLKSRISELFTKPKLLTSCILIFGIIVNLQCVLWSEQAGRWLVWSYTGEGFNFTKPEIINVLFSFRKGLFVYTPLTLISLIGLFYIFRRSRYVFAGIFLFVLICVYVISAWWNWYYGHGFGLRAFIDFYAVFALLLAVILNDANARLPAREAFLRGALYVICVAALALNLVQTYQYSQNIIHHSDMNLQKYRHVFLRTGVQYSGILGGHTEAQPFGKITNTPIQSFDLDFNDEKNDFAGKLYMDDTRLYGAGISFFADENMKRFKRLYVKASLEKTDLENGATNEAYFCASAGTTTEKYYYWEAYRLNEIPGKNTNKINYTFALPAIENTGDEIKFFIWNPNKKRFLADNVKVEVYGIE